MKNRNDERLSSSKRGYDSAWQRLRAAFLREHPMCAQPRCKRPATHVHHVKAVEDAPELRLDPSNLKGLCRECHERLHGRMLRGGCDRSGWPTDPRHPWSSGVEGAVKSSRPEPIDRLGSHESSFSKTSE